MARYKPQDRNSMLLAVVLSEQIVPGSFAFALDYLVYNELDLTAMDAKFKNDEVGASAYDPRVMLKIVLLAYSQGLISSRVIEQLMQQGIPAMVPDNQMRYRDERFAEQDKYKGKPDPLSEKKATGQGKEVKRFRPSDFTFNDNNTATCPAGQVMTSPGTINTTARGLNYQSYTARALDCNACALSKQCLKGPMKPNDGRGRQVTRFEPKPKDDNHPSERMRQAIDSSKGRQLYSQRFGTVEPVFANIRHNKRLTQLNHRGRTKVNTQWNLYCMVHNIEKLAKTNLGRQARQ